MNYYFFFSVLAVSRYKQTISIYNYSSSNWETLYSLINDDFSIPSGQSDTFTNFTCKFRNFYINISNDFVLNGKLNISYYFEATDDSDNFQTVSGNIPTSCGDENINLSIGKHMADGFVWYRLYYSSFPSDISLDIGNDPTLDWNHTSELNSSINTINLSLEINKYLNNCTADSQGKCLVPLIFYSGSGGIINISKINVTYQGNNSCELCISSDGFCDTEWTLNNITTNFDGANSGGNCSFSWNTSDYDDGIYNASFRIKDIAYNTGTSSKQITLDRNAPTFAYYYPLDNGAFNINPINATNNTYTLVPDYSVSDLSSIANCSLIINNRINQTDTSIQKNSYQTFELNISTNISTSQYYNWSINCSDVFGFESATDTRIFTLIVVGNFSGDTTNLKTVNISNIGNLTFEDVRSGKIKFSEIMNLSGVLNVNDYIRISDNKIDVNSSALQELNKSATLHLYNITYANPRPLKDGSPCPSTICTVVSYVNNSYVFNVTQFSVYSSEETPQENSGGASGGSRGGGGGYSPTTLTTPTLTNEDEKEEEKIVEEAPVEDEEKQEDVQIEEAHLDITGEVVAESSKANPVIGSILIISILGIGLGSFYYIKRRSDPNFFRL